MNHLTLFQAAPQVVQPASISDEGKFMRFLYPCHTEYVEGFNIIFTFSSPPLHVTLRSR